MTFLTLSIAAIYADGTTLYSKCNLRPYLWRQLELASELESDSLWTGAGKGLFISILEKINLFHLTSNADAIDVKMDGSVLKNHLLRYWDCLSLLNWIRALILSLLLKLPLKKLKPLIRSLMFLSSGVALYLYKSNIQLYEYTVEYYYHDLAGAFSCYLQILDKL